MSLKFGIAYAIAIPVPVMQYVIGIKIAIAYCVPDSYGMILARGLVGIGFALAIVRPLDRTVGF
jgi:hypothetical protein